MRSDGVCRSCGAPVRWVVTDATGKRMPLNPAPTADGNVWVLRYEDEIPIVAVAATLFDVPTAEAFKYTSHFATCEQADQWRKPRG